jgi:hypothetical protein
LQTRWMNCLAGPGDKSALSDRILVTKVSAFKIRRKPMI